MRHHPWVLADIGDKHFWLAETDPSRQAQGKRIEISKEELNDAVVPLQFIDRIKSGIKKVTVSLGLGRSSSQKKKTHLANPQAASSSSSNHGDSRRRSLRGDESILSALKASREGDHPLSQSVTASPELPTHEGFSFDTVSSPTIRQEPVESPTQGSHRPNVFDRAASTMSTTESVRTIRATDVGMDIREESRDPSPALSPTALLGESVGSNIGGLLSGAGRLLRGVRDRSTVGRNADNERSRSRASSDASDAHGDPSVAISIASAAGHMDLPQALKDITPATSTYTSGPSSPRHSVTSSPESQSEHLHPASIDERISRKSSVTSLVSSGVADTMGVKSRPGTAFSRPDYDAAHETTPQEYQRAEDELIRRQIAESSRPASQVSHTSSPQKDNQDCPPSPDDLIFRKKEVSQAGQSSSSIAPSLETSPASPHSSVLPLITPSSSEDRFALTAAASDSDPAIGSDLSADPSQPLYANDYGDMQKSDLLSSDETVELASPHRHQDDSGYYHDRALVSDEDQFDQQFDQFDEQEDDSDSDDEDGGLQMRRRTSASQKFGRRSTSITNAQLARNRERKESGASNFPRKTTRSGSNNTMRKVHSHGESEPEPEDRRGRIFGSPQLD